MKKPAFFTAIIKKKIGELKSGQTIFFTVEADRIIMVSETLKKVLSVKDFLELAIPIRDNYNDRLYYNPRTARKAERLMKR